MRGRVLGGGRPLGVDDDGEVVGGDAEAFVFWVDSSGEDGRWSREDPVEGEEGPACGEGAWRDGGVEEFGHERREGAACGAPFVEVAHQAAWCGVGFGAVGVELVFGVGLLEVFGEPVELCVSFFSVESEVCDDGADCSLVVSEDGVDGAAWFDARCGEVEAVHAFDGEPGDERVAEFALVVSEVWSGDGVHAEFGCDGLVLFASVVEPFAPVDFLEADDVGVEGSERVGDACGVVLSVGAVAGVDVPGDESEAHGGLIQRSVLAVAVFSLSVLSVSVFCVSVLCV